MLHGPYVIVNENPGSPDPVDIARACFARGIRVVQYRAKRGIDAARLRALRAHHCRRCAADRQRRHRGRNRVRLRRRTPWSRRRRVRPLGPVRDRLGEPADRYFGRHARRSARGRASPRRLRRYRRRISRPFRKTTPAPRSESTALRAVAARLHASGRRDRRHTAETTSPSVARTGVAMAAVISAVAERAIRARPRASWSTFGTGNAAHDRSLDRHDASVERCRYRARHRRRRGDGSAGLYGRRRGQRARFRGSSCARGGRSGYFDAQLDALPWQSAGSVRIGALPSAEHVGAVAARLRAAAGSSGGR